MNLDKLRKWSEDDGRRAFEQLERMRVYAPGNLLDQLEFHDYMTAALSLLDTSDKPRELLLEVWLVVDHVATYLLRDGLGLPSQLDDALHLLPFQFERKLELLQKLRDHQAKLLPNQKSYLAYELHPQFHDILMKDTELRRKIMQLAIAFEEERCPPEPPAVMRHDYEKSRFVPEWWFTSISNLDGEWFVNCRLLNKARNIAAHRLKITPAEVFAVFGVANLAEFKEVLKVTITKVLFKVGT